MRDRSARPAQAGQRELSGHVIDVVHPGHGGFRQVKDNVGGIQLACDRVLHAGHAHRNGVSCFAAGLGIRLDRAIEGRFPGAAGPACFHAELARRMRQHGDVV